MADQEDFTEQYQALWKSNFGRNILASLNELHTSLITDAESSNSLEKGYGLLKEASGVMLSISHLKGKGAQVVPKVRRKGEV